MIFYLVRLLLFVVIVGILLVLYLRRIIAIKQRNIIISVVAVFVVFFILALFPFEYNIVTFNTPEDALKYSYIFPRNIEKIEQKNCAFFIFRDISEERIVHFDKVNGKWRIQSPSFSSKSEFLGMTSITQQYDEANKCQLVVVWKVCKDDEMIQIDDSLHSSFTRFSTKIANSGPHQYEVYYYTVLDSTLTNYSITIDGQTAKLT
jgi:predicted membrane protein